MKGSDLTEMHQSKLWILHAGLPAPAIGPRLSQPHGILFRKMKTGLFAFCVLWAGVRLQARSAPQQDPSAAKSAASREPASSALPRPPADRTASHIRVQSTIVNAPVTVMDPSGNFVQDLKKDDFEILDNGVAQTIQRFGLAMDPVSLVIVVQNSAAVAPLLDQVRPLGPIFSNLIVGAQGKAAVIFFDDRVQVAEGFTRSQSALAKTLTSLEADGSEVRLNDALIQAINMLSIRPVAERRVVIALSEGFDRGSSNRPPDVIHAAMAAGVAIYGLQFSAMEALLRRQGQPREQNPLDTAMARPTPGEEPHTITITEDYYDTPDIPVIPIVTETGDVIQSAATKSVLEAYCGYTGGVDYSHWSAKTLQKQLTKIALEINSQYELAYSPSTLSQTGFHRLQVEVKLPAFKVRARSGYYYPAQKSK
jgi:VWFA-related protein